MSCRRAVRRQAFCPSFVPVVKLDCCSSHQFAVPEQCKQTVLCAAWCMSRSGPRTFRRNKLNPDTIGCYDRFGKVIRLRFGEVICGRCGRVTLYAWIRSRFRATDATRACVHMGGAMSDSSASTPSGTRRGKVVSLKHVEHVFSLLGCWNWCWCTWNQE